MPYHRNLLNVTAANIVILLLSLFIVSCGSDNDDDENDTGVIDYTALGASDATGIGASPLDEGYVFEIEDGLQASGRDVDLVNLGIPGVEADDIEDVELPLAIESEPDLVTVFAGGNDIVGGEPSENFQNNLSGILRGLQDDTDAVVFIATLPDLTTLPRFQTDPDPDVTAARIAAFNDIIRSEAAASGAVIVELSGEPIESFEVSDDGFHPSDAGHQRIAELFLAQIIPRIDSL